MAKEKIVVAEKSLFNYMPMMNSRIKSPNLNDVFETLHGEQDLARI